MSGPEAVDAVVIGGGLVGCGVAYYLAREGLNEVVLLEADFHGAGATGGSFGNIRQQFGTPLEIECSRRGLEWWKTAEARFGVPCPFHEDGYVLLTGREDNAEVLERHAAVQRENGMPSVELLGRDEIAELIPFVEVDDLIYGSYTPHDGHVMPMDGVNVFVQAARELGVSIRQHTKVLRLDQNGDGWTVRTADGDAITAARVILAAGAGTKDLVTPFGIDLDIREVSHLALQTAPAFEETILPTTIDLDSGLCIEREGRGLVLAMLGRNPAPRDHEHLVEVFVEAAGTRAPALTSLQIANQLTAWPTVGGDGHPYVGQVEDNLWAIAFVGHGAMHGPPVAEAIAREAAGNPDPTLDLSPWDLRRIPGDHSVLWRRDATD